MQTRSIRPALVAAVLVAMLGASALAATPSASPNPTPSAPPLPVLNFTPGPSCRPSPTPLPIQGGRLPAVSGPTNCVTVELTKSAAKAKATPTPPPSRIGISGVWEVQIQRGGINVTYVHFRIFQKGDALTGVYLDKHGKRFPLVGTITGSAVRIVVTLPKGGSLVFAGTISGTTDMLGMYTGAKSSDVAFTAAYRPKSTLLDDISPGGALGGIGNSGNMPGGGYPPR